MGAGVWQEGLTVNFTYYSLCGTQADIISAAANHISINCSV